MLCPASGKKAQEGRNIILATLQMGKRCLNAHQPHHMWYTLRCPCARPKRSARC